MFHQGSISETNFLAVLAVAVVCFVLECGIFAVVNILGVVWENFVVADFFVAGRFVLLATDVFAGSDLVMFVLVVDFVAAFV